MCVTRRGYVRLCAADEERAQRTSLYSKWQAEHQECKVCAGSKTVDEACECAVCRRYSRAYVRHLYQAGEILSSICARITIWPSTLTLCRRHTASYRAW